MRFHPTPIVCAIAFAIGNFLFAAVVTGDYGRAVTTSFDQSCALLYASYWLGREERSC